jgi:hypothetical protein
MFCHQGAIALRSRQKLRRFLCQSLRKLSQLLRLLFALAVTFRASILQKSRHCLLSLTGELLASHSRRRTLTRQMLTLLAESIGKFV